MACSLLSVQTDGSVTAQEVVPASAVSISSANASDLEVEKLRRMVHSFGPQAAAPAQLVQLTRDLKPEMASQLFLQISKDYLRTGHCDLAAKVLLQLLQQYPDEPDVANAALLLVRLYSSSELAHAHRQSNDLVKQLHLPRGWRVEPAPGTDSAAASKDGRPNQALLIYALFLADRQLQRDPQLAKNSAFALQCAAAARLSGQPQKARSWLTLLKHKRESDQWRLRALVESWLSESSEQQPPLPLAHCSRSDEPPHLDGILNEAIWQTAIPFDPKSEIPNLKSQIFLAYDAEFCYIAARCQRIAGVDYLPDRRPRTYDADLSGHDQLRLSLDIDRDYVSSFELAIDHRGWTADACWLDASWNPEWFVAAGGGETAWTVEAAIPWEGLTSTPPQKGTVWAMHAERITPSSTTDPAEVDSPEEFGLLVFD